MASHRSARPTAFTPSGAQYFAKQPSSTWHPLGRPAIATIHQLPCSPFLSLILPCSCSSAPDCHRRRPRHSPPGRRCRLRELGRVHTYFVRRVSSTADVLSEGSPLLRDAISPHLRDPMEDCLTWQCIRTTFSAVAPPQASPPSDARSNTRCISSTPPHPCSSFPALDSSSRSRACSGFQPQIAPVSPVSAPRSAAFYHPRTQYTPMGCSAPWKI